MNLFSDFVNLLFRIEYADVTAVPGVTQKASPSTKAEFDEMINGTGVDEAELQREREKTNRLERNEIKQSPKMVSLFFRHLRLAEMLRQYSKEAEMIVMTLPLPRYKGKLIIWMEDIKSTSTDTKLSFQKGSESSPLCCMVGRDDQVSKSIYSPSRSNSIIRLSFSGICRRVFSSVETKRPSSLSTASTAHHLRN